MCEVAQAIQKCQMKGLTEINPEVMERLNRLKPSDVTLEECIRLPKVTSVRGANFQTSGVNETVPGKVELSCFMNPKYGFAPCVALRFAGRCSASDDRTLYFSCSKFVLFYEAVMPFIKQCSTIIDETCRELRREYGLDN